MCGILPSDIDLVRMPFGKGIRSISKDHALTQSTPKSQLIVEIPPELMITI